MLTLPLEPTDDRADPIFKDAASCAQWLGQLQLTNLQLAHSKLLSQINELNCYPMRGLERLNTLELLRDTVEHVQEDLAKKLIEKPLPLSESERLIFLSIVQLWQAMVTGYQRGLQACIAGDKSLVKHGALLCQRCLHYSGLAILEHLRTGYKSGPMPWHQLHELYAYAEQQGLHQTQVPLSDQQTSCLSSYVKTLLSCYANPAQMTRWQLQQMNRWLSVWSDTVTVNRSYPQSRNDAQPLAVELPGAQGLQHVEGLPHHDEMRYLAMVPLSKLIRVKTILLQQGQTPLQVGLGNHTDRHACLELLTILHSRWCERRRSIARRSFPIQTQLCCKPESIFAHLSGAPFQPHRIDGLAVEGHTTEQRVLENWQIENESIMGAGLTRSDSSGVRLGCKQLVALKFRDAPLLGSTVWVNVAQNGTLQMGVKYLPGRPEPIRIRASGINPSNQVAPAFMLPALPSLKTPASLVIPRDWFQAKRVIEVSHQDGNVLIVRLGFSVERGLDYERVSFTTTHIASS